MKDLEKQQRLLDLLAGRALYELSPDEERELEGLLEVYPEWRDDESFELAAAAVSLSALDDPEEMPAALKGRVLRKADDYFENGRAATGPSTVATEPEKARWSWNWLGWAVAAAACIALAVNVWITRSPRAPQIVEGPPVQQESLTLAQMRQRMMDTSADMTKASWSAGNMPEVREIAGDVVWSDAKQAGYMRFTGLPANDGTKETYQLWIFDETQDPKTPIDGGVFNVGSNGEVIIPINAKLRAKNPKMFAVTMEKPGGVVVSDRKKIVALAKV